MLALDDDTGEFHRRFARDPLIGASARAFVGYRPPRLATVAHATLRAIAGQLIESSRARAIERSVLRACGERVATQSGLARLSPAALRRLGLASQRGSTLVVLEEVKSSDWSMGGKSFTTDDVKALAAGKAKG
jgi:3-methyladenine DNA glycosylase/8-oxoguanine DNA glycosylase